MIFDSNSTTSVETNLIPKNWLKLAPWLNLHTALPTYSIIFHNSLESNAHM